MVTSTRKQPELLQMIVCHIILVSYKLNLILAHIFLRPPRKRNIILRMFIIAELVTNYYSFTFFQACSFVALVIRNKLGQVARMISAAHPMSSDLNRAYLTNQVITEYKV